MCFQGKRGILSMRGMWCPVVLLAALAACRTRPVSVVVPEVERDVADLAPVSTLGDTTWRISAAADLREHAHGVSAAPIPAPRNPIANPRIPTAGFAAISPETVNAEPTADLLDDPEGPAVLRAQVMLDRARFSSGVLSGKAGQNMAKAVLFFQEENGLTATGQLDQATYDELAAQVGKVDAAVQYTLTDDDVAGPYYWVPNSVYEGGVVLSGGERPERTT